MAGICFQFLDKKICRFGTTCRFSHDAKVIAEHSANPRPCSFFVKSGSCKFGTQCRQLHTVPAEPRGAKRSHDDAPSSSASSSYSSAKSPPRKQRKADLIASVQQSITVQHSLPAPPKRAPLTTVKHQTFNTAERKTAPSHKGASHFPLLSFSGDVLYARSQDECEVLARQMTVEALGDGSSRVVGMDCEWRPQYRRNMPENKVALVQVALESKCYLFHIHYCGIAPALRDFLGSKQVMKIGIGLPGDVGKLAAQYQVSTRNVVDLDSYAKQMGLVHPKKGSWGVKSLAELLLGQTVSKPKSVQMSNWEADLSTAQRTYAALDAWSCIKMYQALNATHLLAPLIARVRSERELFDEQCEALRQTKQATTSQKKGRAQEEAETP